MRVLLIGGSGFIGQHVIKRLEQRSHEVIIFHRGRSGMLPHPGAERIIGNRLEIDKYIKAIDEARPDAAIDFLPWNDKDTRRVIDALNGRVERVVHLSSGDVYQAWGNFLFGGCGDPVPLAEDAPLRADLFPYAGTRPGMEDYDKVLAERAILDAHYHAGYPGIIIRLPMVYGPGDPHHRMWDAIKRMLDARPAILMSGCQAAWLSHRGHVDDVAFGIVLAAERDTCIGQAYNIGSRQTHTAASWVRAIGDVLGWQGDVLIVPQEAMPAHLQQPYNYQQHILYDTNKIRRELGYYELTEPAEALRLTVEWQRANPPPTTDPARFDYEAEDRAIAALAQEV